MECAAKRSTETGRTQDERGPPKAKSVANFLLLKSDGSISGFAKNGDTIKTKPFGVVECKRDAVSDTEFKQAVEQALGNGHAHKFRAEYIGVIAGQTRAFFDCSDRFGVLEREANIIADLPEQYGKPEEFKYYKNAFPKPDIGAVSRDDLIKTIRKCHQTLWGGGRLSPPMAFGELTKLIFLKTRDEKKARKKGDPYDFQIKTNETPQRLAARIKAMYAIERQNEPDVFNDLRHSHAGL